MPLRKERLRKEQPEDSLVAFGERVRRLMRTKTEAFDPIPPRWDELGLHRGPGDVVAVLALSRTSTEPDQGPETRPGKHMRRRRPARLQRPLLAAAVVLVLLAVGLVATREGEQVTQVGEGPTLEAAAPGDSTFRAADAAPVWTSHIEEPVAAARAYLADAGISVDETHSSPQFTLRHLEDGAAVVDWSTRSGSRTWAGVVYLRTSADRASTWDVVGAASDDVSLDEVRREGHHLFFTVTRTTANADQLAVGLWTDGEPVTVDELPELASAAPDVPLSRGSTALASVAVASEAGAAGHLRVEVGEIDHLELIVYQISGNQVRAVTHMAIGESPAADRDGLPPASSTTSPAPPPTAADEEPLVVTPSTEVPPPDGPVVGGVEIPIPDPTWWDPEAYLP